MTFQNLQDRVSERVIDLTATVQAQVPNLINEAIRSVQRKYNFRAMENSISMVTTLGSLSPTPNTIANFKEYRDKGPYLLKYLTRAKRYMTASGPDAALAVLSDATLPEEPEFLINSVDVNTGVTTFSLAPYPDNISDWPDGNYRIIVPVYVYTSKLVNSGDTNWFVDNMDDYILRQATGHAFGLDWDYNSMTIWLQQADTFYQEAKLADKKNRLSSVDTLVPMWQGANQPQVRN